MIEYIDYKELCDCDKWSLIGQYLASAEGNIDADELKDYIETFEDLESHKAIVTFYDGKTNANTFVFAYPPINSSTYLADIFNDTIPKVCTITNKELAEEIWNAFLCETWDVIPFDYEDMSYFLINDGYDTYIYNTQDLFLETGTQLEHLIEGCDPTELKALRWRIFTFECMAELVKGV